MVVFSSRPRDAAGDRLQLQGMCVIVGLSCELDFSHASDRILLKPSGSCFGAPATLLQTTIMNSNELFNWPDGDVILRATHGAETRDFRVHKVFLSFSSPVFRDMFGIPQPSSVATNGIDVVDVTDPPRALELILRFIYPSVDSPVIDDLTTLSEALVLADKYDIEVARSRLRPSFREFAITEPLRTYAIACRLGLEDEMKIASSHTISIHLPGLTELPDEFKLIPATEYHRLILLHSKYRKEVETIANSATRPTVSRGGLSGFGLIANGIARANVAETVKGCMPLNYESFKLAWKAKYDVDPDGSDVHAIFLSILEKANSLNLTV